MFITKYKSGKYTYIRLMEGARNGKSTSNKVLKNFGRYDVFCKDDPQAYEKLRKQYQELSVQHKLNQELLATQDAMSQLEQLQKISEQAASSYDLPAPSLNYGWYVLKQIWDQDLKLSQKFKNLQRKYSDKYQYEFHRTASYLCFQRLLHPASVLASTQSKLSLLGAPLEDISYNQLLDSLTILAENKDTILKSINERLDEKLQRKHTMIFYDVTNTYFETSLTDEEKGLTRNDLETKLRAIFRQAVADGVVSKAQVTADYDYIVEDDFDYELLPFKVREQLDELNAKPYLRMRGLSKEHRSDLPLISIALVIDEYAIPIDYEIYAGNESEFTTMTNSIEQMKRKYQVQDTIVVADRGLNSCSNLQMLLNKGLGFIMAQKVSNLPAENKAQLLASDGWTTISDDIDDEYRYKADKLVKKGSTNQEQLVCTILYTFSKKRYERDLAQLESDRLKAQRAVKAGLPVATARQAWTALVKKSDKKAQIATQFNQEAYDKRKQLCGYASIVYKKAPEAKNDLAINELSYAYHSLVQIEECFRILKTNLNLRPVYVWTAQHIHGHVLVCIIALILLRLLQLKLKELKTPLSIEQIIANLQEAKVVPLKIGSKLLFAKITDYSTMMQGLEHSDEQTIADYLENNKPRLDLILEAVGLTPLRQLCNKDQLARALGTKFNSIEQAVGKVFASRYMDNN